MSLGAFRWMQKALADLLVGFRDACGFLGGLVVALFVVFMLGAVIAVAVELVGRLF